MNKRTLRLDSSQKWLKLEVYSPLIWVAKGEIFIPPYNKEIVVDFQVQSNWLAVA